MINVFRGLSILGLVFFINLPAVRAASPSPC